MTHSLNRGRMHTAPDIHAERPDDAGEHIENSGQGPSKAQVQTEPLIIRVETESGRRVLYVRGEVDMATADGLRAPGVAALQPEALLIFDLHHVPLFAAAGLGALVSIRKVARDIGTDVLVRAPRRPVRRVFDVTGLDASFGLPAAT
jgi:anti-anti-sigma factor